MHCQDDVCIVCATRFSIDLHLCCSACCLQRDEAAVMMSGIDRHDFDPEHPWAFQANINTAPFTGEHCNCSGLNALAVGGNPEKHYLLFCFMICTTAFTHILSDLPADMCSNTLHWSVLNQ